MTSQRPLPEFHLHDRDYAEPDVEQCHRICHKSTHIPHFPDSYLHRSQHSVQEDLSKSIGTYHT
jgi:hypothetical protein